MRSLRGGWLSRLIAAVLLAGTTGILPHRAQDDIACTLPPLEAHDESKHAIAPSVQVEHDHCAVCHWSRTFRSPFAEGWAAAVPVFSGAVVSPRRSDGSLSPYLGTLPARAPPVAA